jgi:hypothetical protein
LRQVATLRTAVDSLKGEEELARQKAEQEQAAKKVAKVRCRTAVLRAKLDPLVYRQRPFRPRHGALVCILAVSGGCAGGGGQAESGGGGGAGGVVG